MLQRSVRGRDNDARFGRDNIDPDTSVANPSVHHDAFIEHTIQEIDEASAALGTFNRHIDEALGYADVTGLLGLRF